MNRGKTALVTGASSGFGLLIALELARRGYRVAASMRSPEKGTELLRLAEQEGLRPQIEIVRLDVTDPASVAAAAQAVLARCGGRLDVLVNNAGTAVGGFIEEVPTEAWREQLETNFFGLVAVTRAFLPAMRLQAGGRIIQIGSVSGLMGMPGFGPYAASKFAVEGFSESLRHEVARYGIGVALVEPGSFRTAIWDKGLSAMHSRPGPESPYRAELDALLAYVKRTADTAPDPQQVADLVGRLADSRKLRRLRYPVGRGARLLRPGSALLPWALLEATIRRALRPRKR
ncbi:SDR family oxidoreductase [Cohnella fermenti]|uniref:SDR family oxidoreductase n=1 Tax=Cohnella fermenti TaxID=2565925 RepID=A0A4V3WEL2_9BACL|nr:SDR family oxidoreductase [Cohnella fermenti]THF76245.1 SDR family oxidoreductase [Cohnella fermenti]